MLKILNVHKLPRGVINIHHILVDALNIEVSKLLSPLNNQIKTKHIKQTS